MQPGQLATVLELFALRYGVMFALAAALFRVPSGLLSTSVLVPMVAVMTAPVPLLTVSPTSTLADRVRGPRVIFTLPPRFLRCSVRKKKTHG